MFIFESIVRLDITTEPVPPGSILISAFESELIMLSSKFKLSIFALPDVVNVPVTSRLPVTVKLVPTSKVDDKVAAPEALNVPSTTSPSLMLMLVESSDEIEVPLKLNAPAMTDPVPLGAKIKSLFDDVVCISLSVMLILESIVRFDIDTV